MSTPPPLHLWDHYLDADDAASLLTAAETLERMRAIREPLPIEDLHLALRRLRIIAELYEEDAGYWQREATDRDEEATVDGGRWASVAVAQRMAASARELAEGSHEIARVADAAVRDLEPRLTGDDADVRRAAEATVSEAERLLDRLRDEGDGRG